MKTPFVMVDFPTLVPEIKWFIQIDLAKQTDSGSESESESKSESESESESVLTIDAFQSG